VIIGEDQHRLMHYGILRKSGRYPWGSGGTQNVRNKTFLDVVADHKRQGMTDAQIAKVYEIKRNELTAARSIALAQQKRAKILQAQRLKDRGWSNVAIGERMSLNESSVRALLREGEIDKVDATQKTANMLKQHVAEKGMVDYGVGVETQIGVTRTRLDTAVASLREEGYTTYNLKIPQVNNPGQFTTMKVLAKPGTTFNDVSKNRINIQQIQSYSNDNGRTFQDIQPPKSFSSRKLSVNYKEDGGAEADGVIYVRPGKSNLSLGGNQYAQVRIMVDGTHYLKGMAVYKDDLPEGVDLVFNTNKSKSTPLKSKDPKADQVLKPIKDDPELPFGSIVRQITDPKTGKVVSVMNKVGVKEGAGETGYWDSWSRSLSSQMLSKQSPKLAQQQLNVTFERRKREFDEINSLTNPVVKKQLLLGFADSSDAAAVHLKAANLPRQANRVLLPMNSVKPNEIYAPGFKDGEQVVLIRHPHGGRFEIPELTVNNRNRESQKVIGTGLNVDAVGIHHSVAQRLSGADFDGDTVLVIPHRGQISHEPALAKLKDFDPQAYKIPEGSPIPKITSKRKGLEMGLISNLITDMTVKGASNDELSRAIRHSMVVIDAEKHGLDIKASERDFGIKALREEYQTSPNKAKAGGASTLISRAGAQIRVPERTPRPARRGGPIDPATGEKVFEPTGRMVPVTRTRKDPVTGKKIKVPTGELEPRLIVSKQLAETKDARDLSSGLKIENIYADHSNKLKALGNEARKEALATRPARKSDSASKVYANEVESLNAHLSIARRNSPLERQAQLIASVKVRQRKQANPDLEKDELKKIRTYELDRARITTGAQRTRIRFTQSEWDAIQAGAISNSKLSEILKNADLDQVKQLAMPREAIKMTSTKRLRAQSMLANGYTQADVADALGVGLTTLKVALSE
jgi:hypothetical protein